MRDIKENIFKRFKNSIYSESINPSEEDKRINLIFRNLVLHLHPPKINSKVLKFNHTFGLGGMAVVLICMQFFTGLLLRFFYEPFPGRAYDSILHLQNNVLFGQLVKKSSLLECCILNNNYISSFIKSFLYKRISRKETI